MQTRHPSPTSIVGGCSLHNNPKQTSITLCRGDYYIFVSAFTEHAKTTRGDKYKQAHELAKLIDKCTELHPDTQIITIRCKKWGDKHNRAWKRFTKWAGIRSNNGGNTKPTKGKQEAEWKRVPRKKSARVKTHSTEKAGTIAASPNQYETLHNPTPEDKGEERETTFIQQPNNDDDEQSP